MFQMHNSCLNNDHAHEQHFFPPDLMIEIFCSLKFCAMPTNVAKVAIQPSKAICRARARSGPGGSVCAQRNRLRNHGQEAATGLHQT